MKNLRVIIGLILLTGSLACEMPALDFGEGDIQLSIEAGSEWLHDFTLFGPFKVKNPPTMAVWVSDEEGNFLQTIYVSDKMGRSAWKFNQDNRPEALPTWVAQRGSQPTTDSPEADGVTGATPDGDQSFSLSPVDGLNRFYIWMEVNHSVDYNQAYPEGIDDPSNPAYSGGEGGSGQPALVYRVLVDRNLHQGRTLPMDLLGHSDPGGQSDGIITESLQGITTARDIVREAYVILQ